VEVRALQYDLWW